MKSAREILKYLFCLLTGWLFFISSAYPQVNQQELKIQAAFDQYRSQYIQEKLFIHTDKDTYISREICWFRIYYTDVFYNRPASVSKIAYVELLDKNNLPVLQQKVSLKPEESDGSMIIPVNISSGTYRLRAYTSWMKNFSPDYYFEKSIRIINPQNLQPEPASSGTKKYDIQFFPEGGNLVQQLESKVGFRITDAYGKGLACEGTVLNSAGDTVLHFHPLAMGLGHFVFKPVPGQNYKAIIHFQQGDQVVKELPDAYANGFVISVLKENNPQIAIRVQSSAALDQQDVYLFVHGSHHSLPVKKQKLVNRETIFEIKPEEIEDGISRITLFDESGKTVCERLYFKYPENKLQISASADQEYNTRSKIELNLSVTDQSGNPSSADISVAVYRLDSLQQPDELNILSYTYLIAELGPVEHPSFYFMDHGETRVQEMDNLMLTHGWRRFVWQDVFTQKPIPISFSPECYGHIIRGKLVNNISGMTDKGVTTFLSVPSARTEFRVTGSDSMGLVKFEVPGFYGSEEIILQTDPKEDSTSRVEILSPFSDRYATSRLPEYIMPSVQSPSLLDQSIAEQVQHNYAGNNLNRYSMQPVDTNSFYVEPDEKYYLDNYTRFQTMEEVIREYVVSTNVVQRRNRLQLFLANKPQREFFDEAPLILIDGVPFFDANELFQQDPIKIRRIDLINREYAIGYQSFNGIISVTTYKGDLNGIRLNSHPIVLDYPGIPEKREFFSPKYETEDQINSRMPDYRTLLYWSPRILMGNENKKTLNFYTSDLPGNYAAVIMGLSEAGIPGTQTVCFKVKK
ncbi:MAG TPA: hypothetical protein VFI33_15275 [Puia sp.]|nr:hypothetical protein [Puia sp.]